MYEKYVDQQRRQYAKSVPIKDWRKQFKNGKSNQKLLDMVPKAGEKEAALDIGAGEGYHTQDLLEMGYYVIGVELLEKRVKDAHKLGRNYVIQGDAHNLPVASNFFNVVFMHEVLEHTLYPVKALQEVYRVLKDGGTYYASLPLEGHWKGYQKSIDHNFSIADTHPWKPRAENLWHTLEAAGFTNFTINLYSLDSIIFKQKYKLGDKVEGYHPHAFVEAKK